MKGVRFIQTLWGYYKAGQKEKILRAINYKLITRTGLSEKFSVSYRGARFHPFRSSLSRGIWMMREKFHRKDLDLILDFLRSGDCLIDVGANVGTHSICASVKFGGGLCVFSFEPHPRIYGYLVKNIALNKLSNIQSFNLALGDCEGEARLQEDRTDDTSWIDPKNQETGYLVPVKPLDALQLALDGRVTAVKIDVEGYELYVLQGGAETLSEAHFLCLEMGDRHSVRVGYSAQELMRSLEQAGWRLFRTPEAQSLVEIRSDYNPPDVENLVAVRDLSLLRERLPTYQIIVSG